MKRVSIIILAVLVLGGCDAIFDLVDPTSEILIVNQLDYDITDLWFSEDGGDQLTGQLIDDDNVAAHSQDTYEVPYGTYNYFRIRYWNDAAASLGESYATIDPPFVVDENSDGDAFTIYAN